MGRLEADLEEKFVYELGHLPLIKGNDFRS